VVDRRVGGVFLGGGCELVGIRELMMMSEVCLVRL
jgi:hypothetical protein